jgi:hypothetical protein
MEKISEDHIIRRIAYAGGEPVLGTLAEMVYRPQIPETTFAVCQNGQLRYQSSFRAGANEAYIPYGPNNNLIKNEIVLFASEVSDYGTESELVEEIKAYIHRYVDLSPFFENIAAYYVLLTWVYDVFNELPYLRLRGDYGSGKTRFLLIVGSICFRPIRCSGAATISPLFRMIDLFKGTLIVDESDLRMSDEKAEFTKIFNNGNAKGFLVLRSESAGQSREFNPQAFSVFGPKIVAMRGAFSDQALESRFITEETGGKSLRSDIPINLPDSYRNEALLLRNKLLCFRFRNLKTIRPSDDFADRRIEPRLNQILGPLMTLISDEKLRTEVINLAYRYHKNIANERGSGSEAQVLEIIRTLIIDKGATRPSIGEIREEFNKRFASEYYQPWTSKKMGSCLRQSLHFESFKSHGVYVISLDDRRHLHELFERYQIEPLPEIDNDLAGGLGDLGTSILGMPS